MRQGRSKDWSYFGTSYGSETFEIEGVNVFEHKWMDTGQTVNVSDPSYGLPYTFEVYEIMVDDTTIKFAAGEFSEGAWGFYLERRGRAAAR